MLKISTPLISMPMQFVLKNSFLEIRSNQSKLQTLKIYCTISVPVHSVKWRLYPTFSTLFIWSWWTLPHHAHRKDRSLQLSDWKHGCDQQWPASVSTSWPYIFPQGTDICYGFYWHWKWFYQQTRWAQKSPGKLCSIRFTLKFSVCVSWRLCKFCIFRDYFLLTFKITQNS